MKIKSGWESVTIQTPEPTLENPQVETHARISTPGNPDVENHALLNKEQPIKDELSTNQPKIEEPNTEEEKKESPSSEVTFANVHKKITELLASKKIRYNDRAPKETSAITWFMLYGYEPAFVFETMTKLLLIKDTPPFKDDVKFWKPMPITIASLKSYVDQIHSTAESLVETPTQRYAREAEEHRQKNPDPKDFEYFEDWVLAYNLPRGSKTEILKFDSPEEIFDPTTTKEKAGLAKRFYDEFKTAKGGTCKFKRTVAA
ncbi:hypothetical protein [Leptospira stimsonii]|uniref:hypothetical protein n=1 Tax=Leptospira stimsonii TaxID=2202203 RepID=UPI001FEE4B0D|nr:hypothetical protein [Leptospira stimsonii]